MYYTLEYLGENGEVVKSVDYSNLKQLANDIGLEYNTCHRVYKIMCGLLERNRSSFKYAKLLKMFNIKQQLGFYKKE